jgi:hypothetical protein
MNRLVLGCGSKKAEETQRHCFGGFFPESKHNDDSDTAPPPHRGLNSERNTYLHINSDEHDAKQCVRSMPGQPLAPEYHDKPWGVIII